ncbi:trypsin-like peptidase domain-containing protein [Pedobacter sp. MR2016-19]|uniref:S1 family peptidase n=1 Tax=Pedobacter sp. MR2016-19 TaxID=2780089 RepID=UPI001873BCCE|nr:serine protease [Pedobacter sp. MR2016-19]MBE5322021.1 trypsin-like peptidase domain-containing protein [Pedobacter sp. MR2016-19]
MLFGISPALQEKAILIIKKKIRTVTTTFTIFLILPLLVYLLFLFNLVPEKAIVPDEIRAPVAVIHSAAGSGTAFLISPTIMLTSKEVVNGLKVGDQVDISFDNAPNRPKVSGRIKYLSNQTDRISKTGSSPDASASDVAVIEIDPISEIEPLVLGVSDLLQPADEVFILGFPGGQYSLTKGMINNTSYHGKSLFKIDAVSNSGNNGGPCILRQDNTVIGISVGGGDAQAEDTVIKINDVKLLLQNANINF